MYARTVHTPARSQHGHPVRLPFFLNRHQIVPHRNARGVFHFMHRKQRGRVTNQSHGRTFGTQYNHTCSQNTLQKKYNFVKNQVPNKQTSAPQHQHHHHQQQQNKFKPQTTYRSILPSIGQPVEHQHHHPMVLLLLISETCQCDPWPSVHVSIP